MNLVNDWKRIAKKAHSFRLAIAAGVLSSLSTIMAVFVWKGSSALYMISFVVVSVSASIAGFAAAAARLTAQPKMYQPGKAK